MRFLKQLVALVNKDLRLEWRRKELLFLACGLSAMLAAVTSFTLKSAFLSEATEVALFPGLCWLIFLFSVTIAMARSYEHDLELRAIDAILLLGVSAPTFYFAKLVSNFITGMITFWSACILLLIFTGTRGINFSSDFFLVVALVVLGCSALSTLIAALAHNSALRALLFPLLFLPLLFVLFFIAIELSGELLLTGRFSWNSPLIALLIAADVIYILAGVNLLELALKR